MVSGGTRSGYFGPLAADGRFCGLNRLCENSTTVLGSEKPTSTDSIWRVLASGEGSDDPFFILQKQCFGVFTQSVKAALRSLPLHGYGQGASAADGFQTS